MKRLDLTACMSVGVFCGVGLKYRFSCDPISMSGLNVPYNRLIVCKSYSSFMGPKCSSQSAFPKRYYIHPLLYIFPKALNPDPLEFISFPKLIINQAYFSTMLDESIQVINVRKNSWVCCAVPLVVPHSFTQSGLFPAAVYAYSICDEDQGSRWHRRTNVLARNRCGSPYFERGMSSGM